MKGLSKLALRRTPEVEDMLAEIWTFRPELANKNTMTMLLGLQAFLQECRSRAHTVNVSSVELPSHDLQSSAAIATSEAVSPIEQSAAVSDDIEW